MKTYSKHLSTTEQTEQAIGKNQVKNNAGGFVFAVSQWTQLERFLILGNSGGSYYASERKMTRENAQCVIDCAKDDIKRTVDIIVDISVNGRAPKNDPAIFALALLSNYKEALEAVDKVCRISTHLFQYIDCVKSMGVRGWGKSYKRTIQNWYLNKKPSDVAYQVTKYQQRNGWSHRDVLRLAKPVVQESEMTSVIRYAVGKEYESIGSSGELFDRIKEVNAATSEKQVVALIEKGLVREHIPTKWLNSPDVWASLLVDMPISALIRNLGKMSNIGLLKPLSSHSQYVCDRLNDEKLLKAGRVHPINLMMTGFVYQQGRGIKGDLTWSTDQKISAALESAFYKSFKFVEPTNKRHYLALDVSGSMTWGNIANSFITPRNASAAMAMLALRTEKQSAVFGFSHQLVNININENMSLTEVQNRISAIPMGGTDCSLPMIHALNNKIEVDAFVVYTDSETYHGKQHPFEALKKYRKEMGIPAKLIVVAMMANKFTIADPSDSGMLDVIGFDTETPTIMANFVKS